MWETYHQGLVYLLQDHHVLCKSWLGIIFQEACDSSWILLTQVTLSAFSLILKSHIFNPPFFFSPIMVFLLNLEGFPAQIKPLKFSLFISSA